MDDRWIVGRVRGNDDSWIYCTVQYGVFNHYGLGVYDVERRGGGA